MTSLHIQSVQVPLRDVSQMFSLLHLDSQGKCLKHLGCLVREIPTETKTLTRCYKNVNFSDMKCPAAQQVDVLCLELVRCLCE